MMATAAAVDVQVEPTLPLIEVNNIEVIYNHVILVLKGVSLSLPKGGIVALLGGNGAGKSTTLKAISGLLVPERGAITRGYINSSERRLNGLSASEIVRLGVVQVMEGRRCFEHLTVEENLLAGGYTRPERAGTKRDLEKVYSYFPRLKDLRNRVAGYTSGGEQQMCTLGRALMARPQVILLDEPSMGLAPQLVDEIFEIVKRLNQDEGVSFLLAEQNVFAALSVAEYGYILESGRIVLDGTSEELNGNSDVQEFYLGIGGGNSFDYEKLKSYRRRKRWLA